MIHGSSVPLSLHDSTEFPNLDSLLNPRLVGLLAYAQWIECMFLFDLPAGRVALTLFRTKISAHLEKSSLKTKDSRHRI